MIDSLLLWLTRNCKVRFINPNGPYLQRHYLGHYFGRYWYLHRFVAPDGDRMIHDHPWDSAISIVLSGGYMEERAESFNDATAGHTHLRFVHHVNRLFKNPSKASFHRILYVVPCTWTLFGHTEWKWQWGFVEPGTRLYHPYETENRNPYWWHDALRAKEVTR